MTSLARGRPTVNESRGKPRFVLLRHFKITDLKPSQLHGAVLRQPLEESRGEEVAGN
jgi:hypothetical protein